MSDHNGEARPIKFRLQVLFDIKTQEALSPQGLKDVVAKCKSNAHVIIETGLVVVGAAETVDAEGNFSYQIQFLPPGAGLPQRQPPNIADILKRGGKG
jgi:hypothetical protein